MTNGDEDEDAGDEDTVIPHIADSVDQLGLACGGASEDREVASRAEDVGGIPHHRCIICTTVVMSPLMKMRMDVLLGTAHWAMPAMVV